MTRPALSFLFTLLFSALLSAHEVDVKLLSTMKVQVVSVSASRGNFMLLLDGKRQADSLAAKAFQLIMVNDSLEVRVPGDTLGRFASFVLKPLADSCIFKIKPIKPLSGTRTYDGQLSISIRDNYLHCRNEVELESYVCGVVESESGGQGGSEFYKVQAILCRTYALAQLGRHITEGFDVCDGVHCQVYRSRTSHPEITAAAQATAGLVLVDKGLTLITAAFHSNCGGQTANSEDVWGGTLPYLRGRSDSFCNGMPHATWERRIAKDDWLNGLAQRYKYPIEDSVACRLACNMKQNSRTNFFSYGGVRIAYKNLRTDWQLKSAYFNVTESGDSVIIRGRGYGHGVGMCQEGAINMARKGFEFRYILTYYYKGVDIVHISRLAFFREEEQE
ncbi:MAG: SpoIID/LytB domain-containing protein [Bacteroidetes bacterium]|nr:SpoIID/LytB domain-containing protein [Bacteroidota bacterium]